MEKYLKKIIEDEIKREFDKYKEDKLLESPNLNIQKNGYSELSLKTLYGNVLLNIPRFRNIKYSSKILDDLKNHPFLRELIVNMYGHGLSTRRISDILFKTLGIDISKSLISVYTRVLDLNVSDYFSNDISKNEYEVIQVDGKYIKVKDVNKYKKAVLLNIIGIDSNGIRTHIHMDVIASEKYTHILDVICTLKKRVGNTDAYFVVDGNPDLSRAINDVFPNNKIQRCLVHVVRTIKNSLSMVSITERKAIESELNLLFFNTSTRNVQERLNSFIERWGKYSKVISPLLNNFHIWEYTKKHSFEDCKTNNVIEGFHSQIESVLSHHNSFDTKDSLYRAIIMEIERYNNLESICLEKTEPITNNISISQTDLKNCNLYNITLSCNGRIRYKGNVGKDTWLDIIGTIKKSE